MGSDQILPIAVIDNIMNEKNNDEQSKHMVDGVHQIDVNASNGSDG